MLTERLNEANRLVNRHILLSNIDVLDYHWKDFVNPVLHLNNVKVVPFKFSGVASNLQAGSLVITNNKKKIFYNSSMIKTRINFTICHETSHFIFDTNYGMSPEFLASSIIGEYSADELDNELLTDATAGVFMLPDIVIVKYMETNSSFFKMATNLSISHAALFIRLVQFLMNHTNCDEFRAKKLVNKFKENNDKHFINSLLSGWNSQTKEEIVFAFENCI